ncbi:DUF4190 domain-containing protein [Paractinoplanes durhamensis]|uniref:DUF4190 domain-containing protein n=1 Tax=Paractinoplanes durhamensis TaxID=113563 RepID=UPI0036344EF3
MDDDQFKGNPLAPIGLVLSILGGPFGLIVSFLALRRSDRTGEGRGMALAGLLISAAWITIGVFVLSNIVNPADPAVAEADRARPTGTTVTVNPAVADATTPRPSRRSPPASCPPWPPTRPRRRARSSPSWARPSPPTPTT